MTWTNNPQEPPEPFSLNELQEFMREFSRTVPWHYLIDVPLLGKVQSVKLLPEAAEEFARFAKIGEPGYYPLGSILFTPKNFRLLWVKVREAKEQYYRENPWAPGPGEEPFQPFYSHQVTEVSEAEANRFFLLCIASFRR